MEPMPLEERARLVLAALPKDSKKSVTAAEALELNTDATPDYLDSLVDLGLLTRATKGRGKKKEPAYKLSKAAKEALRPPRKPRVAATQGSSSILDEMRAMETRLLERIDALARELAASRAAPPAEAQPTPRERNGDLRSVIPAAIRDADLAGRFGGMVPILEVRKVVQSRTGASRTEFDDVLLALEREFLVDLKIANDPRRPDASEGIAVPGRGLVFFALAR